MDLGRIETNRKRQIQSLQDAKQGEVNNTIYAIQRGEMNARNEMAGAILGSASAAVQIGAQDYKYQRYEFMRAGGSADDFHFDFLGLNSRQPQTNIMWNETRIDQHDIRWN
jgi:hypothetical protein